MKNRPITILGLMSGTSLDGLDMALCQFGVKNGKYTYKLLETRTIEYSKNWKQLLDGIKNASALDYFALDAEFANFTAEKVNGFLRQKRNKPVAIGSHGHTVFHRPELGFTTQMGSGALIAAKTGITTVCDFRSLDVGLGGQGAPLVPIGDELLFGNYDACLNIGGIANISMRKNRKRIAWDICGANMLLNYLAQKLGIDFDKDGKIAAASKLNIRLLGELNELPYFGLQSPKSLGREWFEEEVLPLFKKSGLSIESLLATATGHISSVIATELNKHKLKNVLVTGGGAFNKHLLKLIGVQTECRLIVPDKKLVMFKEAIIFAFLAYLRLNEKNNTLSSVTGARHDNCGGAVYFPGKI